MSAAILRRRTGLLALATLLLAWLPGCAEAPAAPAPDGWPLAVSTDGVIGYLAIRPDPDARWFDELVGGPVAGVDGARRVLLLHLDERVFGGPLALALPVTDAEAFRASFAAAPWVEPVDGDRFRLRLPAEHPLARLLTLGSAGLGVARTGVDPSALGEVGRLFDDGELTLPVRLAFEGRRALLGPSLEGVVVTRRSLDELAALDEPVDRDAADDDADGDDPALTDAFVLGLDVERVKDTYHDEIQQLLGSLRAALLGARMAGFAGLAGAAFGGGRVAALGDAVGEALGSALPPAALWALLEMSHLQHVERVGFRATPPAADAAADPGHPFVLSRALARGELLVRFDDTSAVARLLAALDAAPALPDAPLVLDADPAPAAEALADWLRPLAVFLHGDGPSSQRWQTELVDLLAPWDGRLALARDPAGEPALLLGTRRGVAWDVPALAAWLAPAAEALQLELPPPEAWSDGGRAVSAAGFTVIAGDAARAGDLERLAGRADEAWAAAPADAPAVRLGPGHLAVDADGLLRLAVTPPDDR